MSINHDPEVTGEFSFPEDFLPKIGVEEKSEGFNPGELIENAEVFGPIGRFNSKLEILFMATIREAFQVSKDKDSDNKEVAVAKVYVDPNGKRLTGLDILVYMFHQFLDHGNELIPIAFLPEAPTDPSGPMGVLEENLVNGLKIIDKIEFQFRSQNKEKS